MAPRSEWARRAGGYHRATMPNTADDRQPANHAPTDVLVLQHTLEDPAGYLATWLDAVGARWDVFCAEAGEHYPETVAGYRALAVLGGEWSARSEERRVGKECRL